MSYSKFPNFRFEVEIHPAGLRRQGGSRVKIRIFSGLDINRSKFNVLSCVFDENSKYRTVFLKIADTRGLVGEILGSILSIFTVFWLLLQEIATFSYHEYFNCLKPTVGSNPEGEYKTFCHFDFLKPLRRGS